MTTSHHPPHAHPREHPKAESTPEVKTGKPENESGNTGATPAATSSAIGRSKASGNGAGGFTGLENLLEGDLANLSSAQQAAYTALLGLFASLTDPRPLLEATGNGTRPAFPVTPTPGR